MKIGFIDYYLDEWHANNMPKWLEEATNGEIRVAYAYGEIDNPGGLSNKAWCEKFGVVLCDTIEEVVEKSDCLFVLSPDHPEKHESLCQIPLKSGKNTYVDKTFAPDAETAKRLFALAEKHHTKMFSSSALRFSEELKSFLVTDSGENLDCKPRIQTYFPGNNSFDYVTTSGPGKFSNYAIHQLEMIVALMGTNVQRLRCLQGQASVLEIEFENGFATMGQFGDEVPFSLNICKNNGESKHIKECSNFFPNFVKSLVEFFKTGIVPVQPEETIAVIKLRELGLKALEKPGCWIEFNKTYEEPAKKLKVWGSYDVCVCGGGVSGVVAAIAAANEGKKVLLVEQQGALGGSATLSLVTPVMHSGIEGNPACSYIAGQINKRAIEYGVGAKLGDNEGYFDPLALKLVLEEMAQEAGVSLLYYTVVSDVLWNPEVEGKSIQGIIIENKDGRSVVEAKMFIDATGDADLGVLAGAGYWKGNEENGKNQPISLRYILGGVDIDAFWDFVMSCTKPHHGGNSREGYVLHTAVTTTSDRSLTEVFDKALANGDIVIEDKIYWQVFGIPGRKDGLAFNCPEIFENIDATKTVNLTNAQLIGKKAIFRQLNFYKKYMKGFENAYVAEIASLVGIRESRRLETEYVLTTADLYTKKKFSDYICQSNYPIDIHGLKLKCEEIENKDKDELPFYHIPYRSLVVKGIDNLFVTGRCIGSEFVAQSSLRVMQSARATGEAAGIAAAMAIDEKIQPREIDGAKVRAVMQEKGAVFYV